jgi:hypothetical protein
MAGHVVCKGDEKYIYFSRKPEGRKPLGKPKCKWKGNIKRDFKHIGYADVD